MAGSLPKIHCYPAIAAHTGSLNYIYTRATTHPSHADALRLSVGDRCRCAAGMTLSKALQQALCCPLLSMPSECAVAPAMHRKRAQQPVWAERGEDRSETFYTIRLVKGQEKVVKRSLSGARTSRKCAPHQNCLL